MGLVRAVVAAGAPGRFGGLSWLCCRDAPKHQRLDGGVHKQDASRYTGIYGSKKRTGTCFIYTRFFPRLHFCLYTHNSRQTSELSTLNQSTSSERTTTIKQAAIQHANSKVSTKIIVFHPKSAEVSKLPQSASNSSILSFASLGTHRNVPRSPLTPTLPTNSHRLCHAPPTRTTLFHLPLLQSSKQTPRLPTTSGIMYPLAQYPERSAERWRC